MATLKNHRVNFHFPMGFPMVFPLKPPFSYGFNGIYCDRGDLMVFFWNLTIKDMEI